MSVMSESKANTTTPGNYFSDDLEDEVKQLKGHYEIISEYISAFIILFGLVLNLVSLAVLVKRNFTSPIKVILLGLTVFDIVTLLVRFVQEILVWRSEDISLTTYSYAAYALFHAYLVSTTHMIQFFLIATAVLFGYKNVATSGRKQKWTVMIVCILAIILNIPTYLIFKIGSDHENNNFYAEISDAFYFEIYTWIYLIIIGFVECIVIIVLCLALIIKHSRRTQQEKSSNGEIIFKETNAGLLLGISALFVTTQLKLVFFSFLLKSYTLKRRDHIVFLMRVINSTFDLQHSLKFAILYTASAKFRSTCNSFFQVRCFKKHMDR